MTRITAAGPLPHHTFDNPTVSVHLDLPGNAARRYPSGATVDVSFYEEVARVDGPASSHACLEVARVGTADPHPYLDAVTRHRHFAGATLYEGTRGALLVGRWASWVQRRAALHLARHPTDHIPAHDHVRVNRSEWNDQAARYQAEHGPDLAPERLWDLGPIASAGPGRAILGPVDGLTVLELGCGGGQLGADVRTMGARVIGLDLSRAQLTHAAGRFPVVEADAEAIPLRTDSIDLVLCAFGAIGGFAEVRRVMREVWRVLRPGRRAVWSWTGPVFNTMGDDFASVTPERSYFDRTPFDDALLEYPLTYGDWVEAITDAGLRINALHEPEPDLERWHDSTWPWWSRERASLLPTVILWDVSKPVTESHR